MGLLIPPARQAEACPWPSSDVAAEEYIRRLIDFGDCMIGRDRIVSGQVIAWQDFYMAQLEKEKEDASKNEN